MNFDLLKPARDEVRRLALRETDPQRAREFEPITAGPVVAIALLVSIAVAGAVLAPFRLLARMIRGRR